MVSQGKYSKLIYFYTGLYRKGHRFTALVLEKLNFALFGAQIPSSTIIGEKVYFPHYGLGIKIGVNTTIGNNCVIYQNSKLGQFGGNVIIGDNVLIGAGAEIESNKTVGSNSNIGANAYVSFDVSDQCTVIGNPGRVIR